MKKIIVAIAMLLVAALAISVSAATVADFGAETYYLGNPVKTAPEFDGKFDAANYTATYTLTEGYYVAGSAVLAQPADATAVTSAIKVGVAYDVENLYIGFEATLADTVETAEYVINVTGGYTATSNANNSKFVVEDGKVSGEMVIDLENDKAAAYGKKISFVITETTKNAKNETVNVSKWNEILLTSGQKFELNGAVDKITHTFVLGSEATLGDVVTVEQPEVGVPGQTLPVETVAPETTEAPTTEAPTTEPATEAPTTEAPTTEPATEAPVVETEAPTTEAPADEKGCGSSVAAMGIALVAALGTCAVVVSKKKED